MKTYCLLILGLLFVNSALAADPLPSWKDGKAKQAIVEFVDKVTTEGAAGYVLPAERIAVFDNDGTLWCEQPAYTQFAFAIDRVKALAPDHPEWQVKEPFKSLLEGDYATMMSGGEKAVLEIVMVAHANTTTDEFEQIVKDWLAVAQHPTFARPYTQMVYQPMLEVLTYLRSKDFKTYIVSGGGIEFMRPWVEQVYGIPPEQVIGSSIKTKYELRDGKPVLARLPEIDFIDDKSGKPVAIQKVIGRRPLMAFGNSDGDFEMLEWTTAAAGPRFAMIVHHDDEQREFAYDRQSHVGRLVRGLDEANSRGWTVVSMKNDWSAVFPLSK
jgi:phosphoglycolate phosphatase-like HAD superfamily hydrolase